MSEIVIECQVGCNNIQQAFKKVIQIIQHAHCNPCRIDELERDLIAAVWKVGKACLKDFIEAAGDGDQGSQMALDNQLLKRSPQKQKRIYRSVFGELPIDRYVYRVREKTKALAKPLDEKLGLPADEISYVLEDWIGSLSVDLPFESVASWLQTTLGIQVSSSTAHRRIEKLGSYAEDFNQQREPERREEEQEILVALADGKGVPIRTPFEQRAHQELGTRLPRRPTPQKNYPTSKRRYVPGDKKTQRATAGAFYSIRPNKRTPQELLAGESGSDSVPANKRLWAELNLIGEEEVSRGAVRVFQSLAQELAERDPTQTKPLVCLMDGDRHLWELQREYLPRAVEILDLYHVTEKLWKAAHCFHPEASLDAEQWVRHHLKLLLENKVDSVRGLIKRQLNRKKWSSTKKKHLETVYNYFTTNRQRMRYGDYLAAGYPIGSGVIEGACKHIIGDRMCGTGMHWEMEGAQPMLDMRVTKLNGEWNAFIKYRIQSEQEQLYNTAA